MSDVFHNPDPLRPIRTLADAAVYLELAEARLGAGWIDPGHFRIGASALFTELCDALSP